MDLYPTVWRRGVMFLTLCRRAATRWFGDRQLCRRALLQKLLRAVAEDARRWSVHWSQEHSAVIHPRLCRASRLDSSVHALQVSKLKPAAADFQVVMACIATASSYCSGWRESHENTLPCSVVKSCERPEPQSVSLASQKLSAHALYCSVVL